MKNSIVMLDEMPRMLRTPQCDDSAWELLVLLAFIGRHESIERALNAMKGEERDSTTAASEVFGARPGIARPDTRRI